MIDKNSQNLRLFKIGFYLIMRD